MTGGPTGPALPWDLAVDPSIRLGLELPPLDPPAGSDLAPATLERLNAVLAAAERAGVGTLWLTGGAGQASGGADACTVAAGLAAGPGSVTLGVVAPLAGARNPSLLARDLTSLDVVSSGRSGLLVQGAGCLGEALTVCRSLFTSDSSDFTGECYRLAGAVNRPAPVRSGGPLLLAQPARPVEVGDPAGTVDAWVVTGDIADVEEAARVLRAGSEGSGSHRAAGRPALVWRGTLGGDHDAGVAERVDELHRAGADGLIVSPADGRIGAGFAAAAERLVALLVPLVGRWAR